MSAKKLPKEQTCPICHKWDYCIRREGSVWVCPLCRERYPASLIKAARYPFNYALRLTTGRILWFQKAEIHGDYATLKLCDNKPGYNSSTFPHGIDVRINEIVWCADDPSSMDV
jgi:hypothetical protein